jgi:L-lactate utilization protein LutB
LPGTTYQDLLLCIGCRACNRHCPIRHTFDVEEYIWTPRNYLAEFMDRKSPSVDTCLHCEACRIHCPLEIDLPGMMWMAKMDTAYRHRRSFSHRLLGSPERLARAGSLSAPIANPALKLPPVRALVEAVAGLDHRANLPSFSRQTFREKYRKKEV